MKWLKDFFKISPYFQITPSFFQLDENKEYTLPELIEILKTEDITVGTGNAIVLKILDELVKSKD